MNGVGVGVVVQPVMDYHPIYGGVSILLYSLYARDSGTYFQVDGGGG